MIGVVIVQLLCWLALGVIGIVCHDSLALAASIVCFAGVFVVVAANARAVNRAPDPDKSIRCADSKALPKAWVRR